MQVMFIDEEKSGTVVDIRDIREPLPPEIVFKTMDPSTQQRYILKVKQGQGRHVVQYYVLAGEQETGTTTANTDEQRKGTL